MPLKDRGRTRCPMPLPFTAIVIGAVRYRPCLRLIMKLNRFEKTVDVDRFRRLRG